MRGLARTKYALVVDLREHDPVYRYDPTSNAARLARVLAGAELERAAGRRDLLSVRDEPQSLPGTRYIDFLLPGLIGMNVMGSSVWGVGYSPRRRPQAQASAPLCGHRDAPQPLPGVVLSLAPFVSRARARRARHLRRAGVWHHDPGERRRTDPGGPDRRRRLRRPWPARRRPHRQHRGRHRLDELHPVAHVGAIRRLLHERALSRLVPTLHSGAAADRVGRRSTPRLQRGSQPARPSSPSSPSWSRGPSSPSPSLRGPSAGRDPTKSSSSASRTAKQGRESARARPRPRRPSKSARARVRESRLPPSDARRRTARVREARPPPTRLQREAPGESASPLRKTAEPRNESASPLPGSKTSQGKSRWMAPVAGSSAADRRCRPAAPASR